MCFTVQLSMFIFCFALVISAFCILAHSFWFVKNFLNFFIFFFQEVFSSRHNLVYLIRYFVICQELFSENFSKFFYFCFFSNNSLILTDVFWFVNSFFHLFYGLFFTVLQIANLRFSDSFPIIAPIFSFVNNILE